MPSLKQRLVETPVNLSILAATRVDISSFSGLPHAPFAHPHTPKSAAVNRPEPAKHAYPDSGRGWDEISAPCWHSPPPLPESGLRAWQVLGGLRMRFLVCAGCAKGAWGRPKKDDWSTRVAAREQPEAPRLQFSSGGSHNIIGCSVFYASVMVHGGPLRGAPNKMLGSLHGCGASCARIMPKCWL